MIPQAGKQPFFCFCLVLAYPCTLFRFLHGKARTFYSLFFCGCADDVAFHEQSELCGKILWSSAFCVATRIALVSLVFFLATNSLVIFLDALCYGSSFLKWLRRQFVLCGFTSRGPPLFSRQFSCSLLAARVQRPFLSLSLSCFRGVALLDRQKKQETKIPRWR